MIRKATAADIEQAAEIFRQLHELHVKANPESFRSVPIGFFIGNLQSRLHEENTEIFVSDDKIINAFALVKIRVFNTEDEERFTRRCCYIDCFAVKEGFQRQGIGRKLMEHIREYAQENFCTSLQLGVSAFNGQAQKFYQAIGFTPRTFIMEQKINKGE